MLAYNKATLENLAIHEAAEEAADLNLISIQQEKEIKAHYIVDLYSPNIFVRIGLGLLTIFIVLASSGLIGLVTNFSSPAFILILLAGASFAMLTYMTGTKKHFSSGVDHVLMISTIGFLAAAIIVIFPSNVNEDMLMSFVICLVSFCFFVRFADSLMAMTSFVAAVVFIVNVAIYIGVISGTVLPFVIMIFAGLVYFISDKMQKPSVQVYYGKGLFVMKILALITFYAAGNYAVVDKFSQQQLHIAVPTTLKIFFWIFTMVVPLVYVATGIKIRNLLLCRIGCICIAFSIITYRLYYSILSPEAAMLLAGIIVCGVSYLLMKYLKQPKGGFKFENLNRRKKDTDNLEGVVIAETFGHRVSSPQQETTFGGGSFGGAGAGDRY